MNGVRIFGRTSRKINNFELSTVMNSEGLEDECCEMRKAAFYGLGLVMAVILAIVLVRFIRRKWKTKQYKITQKTHETSLSEDQQYTAVQQGHSVC